MSYKRISPIPIVEGGTDVTSFTTYGVAISNTTSTGALAAIALGNNITYIGQTIIGGTGAPTNAGLTAGTNITVTPADNAITLAGVGNSTISTTGNFVVSSTSAISFLNLFGTAISPTNTTQYNVMPISGTLKNLYVSLTANTNTGANVKIAVYQNGAATSLSVTPTINTPGIYSNTSTSVSVSAGDKICYEILKATTGNYTGNISIDFIG